MQNAIVLYDDEKYLYQTFCLHFFNYILQISRLHNIYIIFKILFWQHLFARY
jgi:hypothetical protein